MESAAGTILAGCQPERFVGREAERAALLEHFRSGAASGIRLLGPPRAGATELLLRTYDDLFIENGRIIPFYFKFRRTASSTDEARRSLYDTIVQFIAFRLQDPKLLTASRSVSDLISLAVPEDIARLAPLFKMLGATGVDQELGFESRCYMAPAELMANGFSAAVMLDSCDPERIDAPRNSSLQVAIDQLSKAGIPYAFVERRRTAPARKIVRRIVLEALSLTSTARVIEHTAANEGVELDDPVRDLLALRAQGDLAIANGLIFEAADRRLSLKSFKDANLLVQDSVYGGVVKRIFDAEFARAGLDRSAERALVASLNRTISEGRGPERAEKWATHVGMEEDDFGKIAECLSVSEIVRFMSGQIEPMSENLLLTEYIRARYMLEVEHRPRAIAFTRSLSELNSGAHTLLSARYRKASSLGLRAIFERFDGQSVPSVLFDYGRFAEDLKGMEESKMTDRLAEADAEIELPEVILATDLAAYYPPISELIPDERAAVAVVYSNSETVTPPWIAAEIDSKLEADVEATEFWCDRLQAAAAFSGLGEPLIWLIAPEGFDPESMDLLRERGGYGSSRAQVELLKKVLSGEVVKSEKEEPIAEYEIIVPMGENAEMIAAHTLEDIARRHSFGTGAINKIKTALVEACINATEHSHSPDGRIKQHFTVYKDRIAITISNRGVRLSGVPESDEGSNGKRRGWGLQLMQKLMDEFELDNVDDGTRIRMTKYLDTE
jgi:serine/threonine-protein kinase RsbW